MRTSLLFLLLILVSTTVSANTVEFVTIDVTSDPVPPGSNVTRSRSRELAISGGRVLGNGGRFRVPFIGGEDHRVTIIGHLTDMLDRVEIVHGNTVERSIRKSALVSAAHTEEKGGKGKIVFDLRAADLPPAGQDFTIRIRFAVEVAGFDGLDCQVVRRGRIDRMEWTTAHGAVLPTFEREASGRTYADLRNGQTYTLRLLVFKAPASVQIGDGITRQVVSQPNATVRKTEGRAMKDTIDLTFRASEFTAPANMISDRSDLLSFGMVNIADADVRAITSGWGSYVYSRISPTLPAYSTVDPLATNLDNVRMAGFGGGGGGGGVTRPIRGSGSSQTGQPDITVTIDNALLSGVTFTPEELARYRFCETQVDRRGQRITIILPLTVKVTNTGAVDIDAPFTVTLAGGGNGNFFADRVETIRSLHVGETFQIIVQRRQSVACAPGSGTGCPRCPDNLGGNGINVWNDRGFTVNVDSGNAIAESSETNNAAAVAR